MSFYITDVSPPLPPPLHNLQRSKNYHYFSGIVELKPLFCIEIGNQDGTLNKSEITAKFLVFVKLSATLHGSINPKSLL